LGAPPETDASGVPERSTQFNSYLPYFHAQKQQQQQQEQQQQHCQVSKQKEHMKEQQYRQSTTLSDDVTRLSFRTNNNITGQSNSRAGSWN
jgi:hypothetical protein